MNRFGVVAPFAYQPTRRGLRGGFGALGTSYNAPVGAGAGAGAETGAQQGASIGSAFGPIGSVVGGVIGAVGGAIAGSINKKDPEQYNFDQAVALWQVNPNNVYNIGNKYLVLAGLFDLKLSNPHIPIYLKYGRMGEQKFTNDFANVIYQAAMNGQITAADTPETIMSRIVQPWIDSWGYGPMVDPHADLINKIMIGMIADYVSGQQSLWLSRTGVFPFGNIPNFPLAQVLGTGTTTSTTTTTTATPVTTSSTPTYSASGTAITPTYPGVLTTPLGTFSVTGTTFAYGSTAIATSPTTAGLAYINGAVYRYDANGATYVWNNGWVATTQAPTPPSTISSGITSTSSVNPVGSTTTTTTATPQQLVASPPAVGTVVAYAPDMSQGGIAMGLPANLEYDGSDPYNGSWILQNTATGQMYVVWSGQLQPYTSNMFAPASTATTSTTSSVPIVTGSGSTGINTASGVSTPLGTDQTGAAATPTATSSTDNSGLLLALAIGGGILLASKKSGRRSRR